MTLQTEESRYMGPVCLVIGNISYFSSMMTVARLNSVLFVTPQDTSCKV